MRCMLEKKRRSSLIPIFTSRDSMISVFSRFGASSTNERTASFFFQNLRLLQTNPNLFPCITRNWLLEVIG